MTWLVLYLLGCLGAAAGGWGLGIQGLARARDRAWQEGVAEGRRRASASARLAMQGCSCRSLQNAETKELDSDEV